MLRLRLPLVVVAVVCAVIMASCGNDDTTGTTIYNTSTTTYGGDVATTAGVDFVFGPGVTPDPCPAAINPDNGCITLGVLSDLEAGPYAELGASATRGQLDFWDAINRGGGIGGRFDVALPEEFILDSASDPERHLAGYRAIATSVAAVAQSLGTEPTLAILDDLLADGVVAIPVSSWSGWAFPDVDGGLVLESGAPYCLEGMNSVDFAYEAAEGRFTYGIVALADLYGQDYSSGVRQAATVRGLATPVFEVEVSPGSGAALEAAVGIATAERPDVIFIAAGPAATTTLVSALAAAGYDGIIVGAGPTWSPGAVAGDVETLAAFEALFFHATPVAGWYGETAGHDAMTAAAEASGSVGDVGYQYGWVASYPMLALLEQAVAAGDLSRSGLAALAVSLEDVDYGDMLPARSYTGDPSAAVERRSLFERIDGTMPGGTFMAAPFFAGATAADHPFARACARP